MSPSRYCSSGYYDNGYGCVPTSSWTYWGRWVFAGVVVVIFIIILFLLGCVSARRRRRRGLSPMYGTGWMGGKYGGNPGYNNGPGGYGPGYGGPQYGGQQYAPPPPQYSRDQVPNQYTGTTFNSNDGYYGNHHGTENIPLQQPGHTYAPNRGGEGQGFEPPPGPPPSKIN